MAIRVPCGVDGRSVGPPDAPTERPRDHLFSTCPECWGDKRVERRDPTTGLPYHEKCAFCDGQGFIVEGGR